MSRIAIELQSIHKEFPARRGEAPVVAVDSVNMTIEHGEFFSMLGPSGCGKTTTLRMIAGFEKPNSGKILINGRDVSDIPPFHRPVNTVFQDYALFPHMNIAQNVGFGLEMERVPRKTINERVAQMLDMVQLRGMERRFPRQLSGGQQQRVALARALIKQPEVLLLDEPLGALDLKLRKQMQLELKQMQRRLGITFIYVTHDQEEALTMSDRIAVMNKAHVLQIGRPVEIYDKPATRFVADFIGETNFLDANVKDIQGQEATVMVDNLLPLRVNLHSAAVSTGEQVSIAIRPEKITLHANGNSAPGNCLPGVINEQIFIGTDTRYVVRLTEKSTMVVRAQNGIGSTQFAPGTPVSVQCLPDYALILKE